MLAHSIWAAMKIFTRVACRPLFIAGKNAELMVATMLKNSIWQLRSCSVQYVIVLFVSVLVSVEINRRHYLRSDLHLFLTNWFKGIVSFL